MTPEKSTTPKKNTPQPAVASDPPATYPPPNPHPAIQYGDTGKVLFGLRANAPRKTMLGIRGTTAELERLVWLAERSGIRSADLIRQAIVEWIERHIPRDVTPPGPKRRS